MVPPSIQRFNELAVWILGQAYADFPENTILNLRALIAEPSAEFVRAFSSTVQFLSREGFIVNTFVAGTGDMADAQLTAKGLAVLNRVPDSLSGTGTLGERAKAAGTAVAKQAATDAAKEGARIVVRELFAAIISASTRP